MVRGETDLDVQTSSYRLGLTILLYLNQSSIDPIGTNMKNKNKKKTIKYTNAISLPIEMTSDKIIYLLLVYRMKVLKFV